MKVIFSRHTKRRAQLYKIPEITIEDILKNRNFEDGKYELIERINNFKLPIKIVISVENKNIIVITVSPLEKGEKM